MNPETKAAIMLMWSRYAHHVPKEHRKQFMEDLASLVATAVDSGMETITEKVEGMIAEDGR